MTLGTTVCPPRRPGSGAAGQVVGRHRPAHRRPAGRRGRPGSSEKGLRQRRARFRRAVGPPRRVDRRAAGAVEPRRPALRRPLLLDRGGEPRSPSQAARRPADLDRELGIRGRTSPHGPAGRQLARVGLQHDAVRVRRGVGSTARPPPCRGQRSRAFPNAWRPCGSTSPKPGGGRPGHAGTVVPTIHRPEDMLRARLPVGPAELFAEKLSDFARAGVQRVFAGLSPTRLTSWSGSGRRSDRRSSSAESARCRVGTLGGELRHEDRGVDLGVTQQEGALVEPPLPSQPTGDFVVALARVAGAARRHDVRERVSPSTREGEHAVRVAAPSWSRRSPRTHPKRP